MTRQPHGPPRRLLARIHRWVGLAAGLLLLSQGLTGTVMIFRNEINFALHHRALQVSPRPTRASLQAMTETVRASEPNGRVVRIDYPTRADEALLFSVQGPGDQMRFVAVDPYRGVITRAGGLSDWPVQWLFELHRSLLSGDLGANLIGLVGACLLFMAVSGPFVWWPGRQALRTSFRVTFGGGAYRSLRDLHRLAGVVLAGVLLTTATTGLFIVWKTPLQPILANFVATRSKPSPKVAERPGARMIPLETLVASAQARYGGDPVMNVRFPKGDSRVVLVFIKDTKAFRPRSSNQIWLNGYTGERLGVYEAASLPPGNAFLDWMMPIHSGEFLGLPGRVIFWLGGLSLPAFAATGASMWFVRRRRERGPTTRTQTLELVIAGVVEETPDVRGLELRAADGRRLPAFTAGAHIDVHLPGEVVRQYSLWNDPADCSRYCIAVRRQELSRGGSRAVHELIEGERLRVGMPRNSFPLSEGGHFSLLIAGGVGVTPLMAMAHRLDAAGRAFSFHYAARSRSSAALLGHIQAARWASKVVLHLTGEPEHSRFDIAATLKTAPAGAHLYVCGPTGLIDAVLTEARQLGWGEERLHAELFQASTQRDPLAAPFDMVLRRSEVTLHVPSDRTAAEVLAEHGVKVGVSCGQGICGACMTRVLAGQPEHRDRCLTPGERARNDAFTPCCSRARTPVLVLDL
jgi:vanillate O-demethylase ferredoxin subunit